MIRRGLGGCLGRAGGGLRVLERFGFRVWGLRHFGLTGDSTLLTSAPGKQ